MAKLSILAGATSQSVNVFVRDSTSTTGAGLASVAPAGGALLTGTKLYYSFTGANASAGVAVSLSVLAAVNTAWTSAGIVTLDGTNMIGWVRIDIPNAALTTAKGRVVSFLLFGGTNMAPTPFEVELTAIDNQSTAFGLVLAKTTNITGFNDLSAAAIAAGVWQDTTAGDFTVGLSIGKSVMNGVSLGTGLTVAAVSGAVGSVTSGVTVTTNNDKTGYSLSVTPPTAATIASAVWQDTTAGDFTVSASVGKSVMNGVALGTGLTVAAVSGAVGSVTSGVTVTTNNDKTGYTLTVTPPTAGTIATTVLTTQMTESYRTAGTAPTLAQAQFELVAGLLDHSIAGTTKTIRNIAGTAAKTYTLDSSTAPTSITETT